jgi:hypothetical protein
MLRERRIEEEIAARARELWKQNGSPEGRDLEFWLQAEEEISDRYRKSSGARNAAFSFSWPPVLGGLQH